MGAAHGCGPLVTHGCQLQGPITVSRHMSAKEWRRGQRRLQVEKCGADPRSHQWAPLFRLPVEIAASHYQAKSEPQITDEHQGSNAPGPALGALVVHVDIRQKH